MKNLDQRRAKHALESAARVDSQAVDRVPSMIVNNGLLATLSFALAETSQDKEHRTRPVLEAVVDHLKQRGILNGSGLESALKDLQERSAVTLQRATDEALAYLSFLKRFAKMRKGRGEDTANES